jgi:hypothetical protein
MTILIAAERESFCVMAADRMWQVYDAAGIDFRETRQKIVLHPTLPLAMCSGGFGSLPPGGKLLPTLLEEIMATITRPSELTVGGILRRAEDRLRPLVQEALADPSRLRHHDQLTVIVALVRGRRAEIGRLNIAERVSRSVDLQGTISTPPTLEEFYTTGRNANWDVLFGAPIRDPSRLASHLRVAIENGVEAERALNAGVNRETGGGVDVALVDASGARFVERV